MAVKNVQQIFFVSKNVYIRNSTVGNIESETVNFLKKINYYFNLTSKQRRKIMFVWFSTVIVTVFSVIFLELYIYF